MVASKLMFILRISTTVPYNFVSKSAFPKYPVAYHANVVRNFGFYVDYNVPIGLQNPITFYNSRLHKPNKVCKLIIELVKVTTRVLGWVHVYKIHAFIGERLDKFKIVSNCEGVH